LSPETDSTTDATAIARVLEGEVEAFAVLVDRYQGEYLEYARYMTGSADEAADIIQESFVRAYRSLRSCKDPANFKSWFFRIVTNQCKTHLARRRPAERVSGQHQVLLAPGDAGRAVEADEVRRLVHVALQQLPVEQREALVMRHLEGLSLAEMAELAGASVPALKMRLLRGRAALRAKLEGVVL
jgi:RNA polymerase sigma-70 factor (ECF subfamily)